jgi:death-on-curing protein
VAGAEETRYLGVPDVVALHQFVMEGLGFASAPLLREDLLESALMRPRMAAYYEGADLTRQAALLAVGIVQAHAFMDGNKRTAYEALRANLAANGLDFVGRTMDLAQQLEAVAAEEGQTGKATDQFESWLRERVRPRGPNEQPGR